MTKEQAIMYLRSMQGICSPQDRMAKEAVRMAIEALSADRPMGEWTNEDGKPITDKFCVYCSKCKEWSEYRTNYCGHCGARMR